MRTQLTRGVKALAWAALLSAAATAPATAQTVYGLQATASLTPTFSLVTFQASAPGTFTATAAITGLGSGQVLVGLDARPSSGQLFALGYNSGATTGNAQLYTLATSGALTAVGSAITLNLGTDLLPKIGFDFNPTVDRIRVTAANGANYRLNPNDGTIAFTDGNLAYATTDANTGQMPAVGASAYTNSFANSTSTTLYNIDEMASRLVTQNPPNNGTLNTVATLSVSVNATGQSTDLDIAYVNGQNIAYMSVVTASITLTATSTLYTVNLTTGAATSVGTLGSANASTGITDIAVVGSTGTTLAARSAELATNFSLFPNPLAGAASLSFGLPRAARVQLLVSDALGRQVDALDAGLLPAGTQTVRWSRGSQAAGLYFFSLRFDGQPAGTRTAAITQ